MKNIKYKYLLYIMIIVLVIFYAILFYIFPNERDRIYLVKEGLKYFIIYFLFSAFFIIGLFNIKYSYKKVKNILVFSIILSIIGTLQDIIFLFYGNIFYLNLLILLFIIFLINAIFGIKQDISILFFQIITFLLSIYIIKILYDMINISFIFLYILNILGGYVYAKIVIYTNKWILKKDIRKNLQKYD